jgi:hypothetical protein
VAVDVSGFDPADALGASKRVAEQSAAQAFMAREKLIEAAPSPAQEEGVDA